MEAPQFSINLHQFWTDPYPALAQMREQCPICFVPELDAILLTRRDDIFTCEKLIDIFSSVQPGGLMVQLMGDNMMRKDGESHMLERRQAQPSLSPRTVKSTWITYFKQDTIAILDELQGFDEFDVVRDYAMPVCASALRRMTGLSNLSLAQIDHVSQSMIDGIANYSGDADIEQRCRAATRLIDESIDARIDELAQQSDASLISVLVRSGQPIDSVRANIKLAISGGQNEPRDAIAGCVYALLSHPTQLDLLVRGDVEWISAFEEYARWMSPIGMSPRRIVKEYSWNGVDLQPDSKAFLMFGSANRDEQVFARPNQFDITRDVAKSVSFGAGPHFCAGAAASRALIAQVALPLLFERFPNMQLDGAVEFRGWAFRGPLVVPVRTRN